jgi:crotonobetainyl-CoA:carnitine CoA-transferase CaiB-like acyl-CoA transferase
MSGIGMALFHRERHGEGQLVDASLLRVGTWVCGVPLILAAGERGAIGARGQRRDRTQHSIPTFNTYKTKDGSWIQLLGLDFARHIKKTLRCLGIEHILSDPRFSTYRDMMIHRRDIIKSISEAFETKSLEEWKPLLRQSDVWFSEMRKFEEVLKWEQLIQTGGVDNVAGIGHGIPATPVKLSACEQRARGRAPDLGAHTKEVLSSLMRSSKL